jgi:hypothetical protein
MKTNQLLITFLTLGVLAHAEDFAAKAALKQTSMTQGFTQATLPVLHRVTGIAPQIKVCTGCVFSVSADASAADFRDPSVEAKAHSLAKPLEQKMSLKALDQAGRKFISSNLAGAISLAPGEEMVPLSTDYRVEGEQDLSTGKVTRNVVANRVVFGRTINGVSVVGNGSTVVVTFANDGSVESFHYDWPKYEVEISAPQSMAVASTLLDRVEQVVGPSTKLQTLQCGYYDPGAGSGHSQVQPGCLYHAVFTDTTGVRQGYSGAVPGGLQFEADAKWKESQLLK